MKKRIKNKRNLPRLYVFRSNKHIYAQVIDDIQNITLASSSSICNILKIDIKNKATCAIAQMIGQDIGDKLLNKGIKKIIFDRGKKMYHGKIKALAEATRNTGIEF